MDTYADDLAALVGALDLKAVIHVGHSTGGGRWLVTSVATARAGSPGLKVYPGAPHGMCSTHKDEINADLLGFLKAAGSQEPR